MATCNKITICKGEDGKYEIKNKEPLEDDTPALVDDSTSSVEGAETPSTGESEEVATGTVNPTAGAETTGGGKRRRRKRTRKSRRKSKSRKSKRRKSSKKKSVKVKASTMRKHSKNHTKRHMKYMKKMMKKGYSFKKAHRSTMRKVGK